MLSGTAIHLLRYVDGLLRPLMIAALLFGSIATPAAAQQILVVGDSLSAAYGIPRDKGWVSLLADALPDHAIVNASISGETTEGGRQRLPALLEQHAPDIVLIELGGNDGLRGFPLARIRANLREMVQMSQQAGAKVLLLGMKIPPNYGARYAQGFEQIFREIAADMEVPSLPFFLDGVALADGMMQDDGIHPTSAAQQRLLDNVLPALEELLADSDR